jgi:hypothetical protein
MYAETDLAWAAGFIDGEGCIRITAGDRGGMNVGLTITQKSRIPLDHFVSIFGGNVQQRTGNMHL